VASFEDAAAFVDGDAIRLRYDATDRSIAYGHFGPDGREVAGEVTDGSTSIGRHMLIDGCWI